MDQKIYRITVIVLCAVIAVGAALLAFRHTQQPASEAPSQSLPTAADFTVQDADGALYKLSDFFGEPIVLNFWASWCGPCKSEMPALDAAYQAYGDQIHFLMIDLVDGVSETVDTGLSHIQSQGYTFPVYFDVSQEAAYAYNITSIPLTCFINTDGVIVSSHKGTISAQQLEAGIASILPKS